MIDNKNNSKQENNLRFITTTDSQTAKKLKELGFEKVKEATNKWVFKNQNN